jgi:hypothetical protein
MGGFQYDEKTDFRGGCRLTPAVGGVSAYAAGEAGSDASFLKAPVYLDGLRSTRTPRFKTEPFIFLFGLSARRWVIPWMVDQNGEKTATVTGSEKTVAINLNTQEITNNGHTYYMFKRVGSACILLISALIWTRSIFAKIFPSAPITTQN